MTSENTETVTRYFLDIRGGCGAVRDRLHESFDPNYPGLHFDTVDVVEYKHGFKCDDGWCMTRDDIEYLKNLCELLNKTWTI